MGDRGEALRVFHETGGYWAGSDDNIKDAEETMTADDARQAAEDILGAIGHDELVTISGFRAVDAVAGLRKLAKLLTVTPIQEAK